MQLTYQIPLCNPPEREPIDPPVCLAASPCSAGCTCHNCGKSYTPKSDTQKYCSKRCSKVAENKRASMRKAKYAYFVCPSCGLSGTRRWSRGKRVVTCGGPACVEKHKLAVRKKLNERYRKAGITWPSQKKDECLCGKKMPIGAASCGGCRSAIARAKKYLDGSINPSLPALLIGTCKWCGRDYRPKRIHQVFCSKVCGDKSKEQKYKAERRVFPSSLIKRERKNKGVKIAWSPEKKAQAKIYRQKRIQSNKWYRPVHNIRSAIRRAINQGKVHKKNKTFDILGYSYIELAKHIEAMFEFGMTWKNYGEWHIDHIKPVSHFKIKSERDIARIWSLKNLRPRWATNEISKRHGFFMVGNIEKGNRFVG